MYDVFAYMLMFPLSGYSIKYIASSHSVSVQVRRMEEHVITILLPLRLLYTKQNNHIHVK